MKGGIDLIRACFLLGLLVGPGLGAQPPSEPSTAAEDLASPDPSELEPAAEAEPDPRNAFEIELEDGGTVTGLGLLLEFSEEGSAVLSGDVEILYEDVKITAERIELDPETEDVVAEGNVVFDQGPRRMSGSRLELNLETKTGALDDVSGFVSNDYFFEALRVEKTGEDSFTMYEGRFSSCQGEVPAWSFAAKKIDFVVDDFARARGATFRAKKAPLFYLPWVRWPVLDDRSSGLLIPKPGFSNRRGTSLGLGYYQTLGRSADTSFYVDLYAGGAPAGSLGSGSYLGIGNEIRYRPNEGTTGIIQSYVIQDPELDLTRWKLRLDHESKSLPGGFRGVVRVDEVSDFEFFRDFERRGDRHSQRQLYSYGFLTRNWRQQSLNVQFDRRETFLSGGDSVTLTQLPEVDYRLRSTRLGRTPLYLQLKSSVNFVDNDRSPQLSSTYGRADVFPEITMPIRSRPWISMSFTGGGRFTWWGDSLRTAGERTDPEQSQYRNQALTRFLPTASADIVGPSFSRIFDRKGERWSKLKHVIEPRFTYSFFEDFDDSARVPVFDEVDNVRGRNVGRISLANRLLAKPAGDGGSALQILSLELFQDISFDPDQPLQASADRTMERSVGPLTTLLRFTPSRRTSVRAEAAYSTLFSELESTSLSASFSFRNNNRLGVRWVRRLRAETGVVSSDQTRFSTRFTLVPNRLTLTSSVDYDIERSLLQLQRHLLSFRGSCYGLSLEAADYRSGRRRDREFRFLVTLKNVGTFLDITGGESETL